MMEFHLLTNSIRKNFMSLTLNPLLMQLLEEGVEITMMMNANKQVVYNLNSGAKSHMYASVNDDGSLTVHLRYDETQAVRDFDELLMTANYARHGRDYMNSAWVTLLQKYEMWND